MRFLAGTLLSFAVAQEQDGCWTPIRAASVVSSYGSSGFSVQCPATSSSFLSKRGPQSFLQTERASRDPIMDFCLVGSASPSALTSEAHVELQLDGAYVIRGADFVPSLLSSYSSPSFFKLDARESPDSPMTWYASQSDSDSGTAWTKLAMGSSTKLSTDLAGAVVRIGPIVTTPSSNNNAFGVELYGCTVASTTLVSFRFKSSRSAIITRFGKLSSFLTHLTEHVCFVSKLSSAPALCSRVVISETKEGIESNPQSAGSIAPNSLPFIEIIFRILPAGPACSDCRSADTVRAQLQSQLAIPTSLESRTMKAIDVWIEDSDPYTCASKTCPSGTLCIYGRCVTAAEIIAEEASKTETDIAFSTTIDNTLNLSPLNVISGADITSGILTFAKAAPAAGAVLTVTSAGAVAAPAPPTTEKTEDSIIKRFMIPIIAGGAIGAIVFGLIGYKMYQRKTRAVDPSAAP